MQNEKKIIHVHQKCGKHHILTNVNRNMAEPREVTKQVVWIILRNGIFHGTFRHNRSGFPSYARKICALTLPEYALSDTHWLNRLMNMPSHQIKEISKHDIVLPK